MANDLSGDIVQVCLQQNYLLGMFRDDRGPHEDAQHIGTFGESLRSASASDGFNGHCRHRAEAGRQSLGDGGTGGSRQFGLNRHVGQWNTLQNLGCSGSRNRTDSVVDLYEAATGRNCIADHPVNTQQIKRNGHTHDINNRINRTDFMEMNLFDRGTMNASFRFSNRQEHLQSELSLARRQRGCLLHNPPNVRVMAVSMLFRMIDQHMQRSKAALDHGLNTNNHIRKIQRSDSRTDFIGISTRINQGRKSHVSTETGCAFKPGDSHEYSSQEKQKQIS